MLERELAKAKAKGKVVGVFKIDLDKMRDEINLPEEKLDNVEVGYKSKKNYQTYSYQTSKYPVLHLLSLF